MWKQLHSTGEREVTIFEEPGPNGERRAESIVRDWPGHHPVLCTVTIETMCAIFETMGCREVEWRRTKCISKDGGRACVTERTWREP